MVVKSSVLGTFRDLFSSSRILWQCFFGSYCVGLDRLLPVTLVSCLDEGGDFDLIRDQCGIQFVSLEQPGVRRFNWIGSGIEVVTEKRCEEIETQLGASPRDRWLVTSTPASEKLEAYCRENGYRYVGTPARTASRFKHKQRLYEALEVLDLPRPAGRWLRLRGRGFQELRSEFSARFVVQRALGAAGSGTFLVSDESGLESAAAAVGDESIYVAPFLGGFSLNVNAIVVEGRAYPGFPNVQLSGVEQLSAPWGGYCGNDYTAASQLEGSLIRDVQAQTERIGEWLAREGFDGLYGLDFVINEDDGRAYGVDLNPRWQGSTVLSIQAELAAGRLPMAIAEFAWRCGVLERSSVEDQSEAFRRPIEGAQMCLRMPARPGHTVGDAVSPGLYRSGRFLRPALRFEEFEQAGDWILTGGVPRQGTLVEPGAWLVRIYSKDRVVGDSSSALSGWASNVAVAAYRMFGVSERPAGDFGSRTSRERD